jgi:hypothetical protein
VSYFPTRRKLSFVQMSKPSVASGEEEVPDWGGVNFLMEITEESQAWH